VLEHFTQRTLDGLPSLLKDIQATRMRGWSIDDEEHTLGMCCIAAPIFNEYGEGIAGISVSGPAVRLPKKKLEELGPLIRATADQLTRAIGGKRPEEL
jgi:IclR family acetate operon transcriptional repressor